jgi:Ran GTPase-activating protein (RanGAP) involved in mRNA processing and transport
MNKYIEILNVTEQNLMFGVSRSLNDIKLLSEALKENKTLITLELKLNNIGNERVEYISNSIKENKTLTSLDLSYNCIEDEGLKYIADTLKTNKTLTSLDLTCNGMGNQGLEYIAHALKENTTLTTLILGKKMENNEINKLIELNKKYKKFMEEHYKLVQEELIEISLVPPYENNIPVLRNGGSLYKELCNKYN